MTEPAGYRSFTHVIPSLRFTKVAGAAAGVGIVVPGAAQNDILLGVTQDGAAVDLLDEATLEDGTLTLSTTDTTGEFLSVVFFDEDGDL